MAGPRQPIALLEAKNRKHLTKAEIAERRASEVQPATDDIKPPSYLTAAQKKHFVKLADQLGKIKIMGETDVDTLARYVVAETQYQDAVKEQRKLAKERPNRDDEEYLSKSEYFEALEAWNSALAAADRRQERYFKQASTLARDLGLTISSRCKLVVPKSGEEKPKENKFAQFATFRGKAAGVE